MTEKERWEVNIEYIKNEILTQDTLGTAQPILLLLQTPYYRICHNEYNSRSDRTIYVEKLTGECNDFESVKDLQDFLRDNEYSFNRYNPDQYYEQLEQEVHWQTENVFFTHEGYKAHMEQNKHNYRNGHRIYVIHAFRNPEIKVIHDFILDKSND